MAPIPVIAENVGEPLGTSANHSLPGESTRDAIADLTITQPAAY
jgi:hypothetical protein